MFLQNLKEISGETWEMKPRQPDEMTDQMTEREDEFSYAPCAQKLIIQQNPNLQNIFGNVWQNIWPNPAYIPTSRIELMKRKSWQHVSWKSKKTQIFFF